MSSQDVLQAAMAQYDGTIIVVSHNRYFLDGFVNKVLEVRDGRLTIYEGTIAEYLLKQEELRAEAQERQRGQAAVTETNGKIAESADSRKEKKRQEAERRQERSRRAGPWLKQLAEAEEKVEFFERQKEELEAQMADPALYADENGWAKAGKEYADCQRRLERWYEKWETAQQKIDQIDADL
jgi:ATP-binding cassette subfamily F protein 3